MLAGGAWTSLNTVLVASRGSSFALDVTSAIDSSGAIATLCGGADQPPGASSSAITRGAAPERSRIVTVSALGFAGTVLTPSTQTALLSLDETAICVRPSSPAHTTARSVRAAVWNQDARARGCR